MLIRVTEDQLYKLNSYLLLEVRVLANRGALDEIRRLVDCFHNLPEQLRQMKSGQLPAQHVAADLDQRSEDFQLRDWLDNKRRFL
ncbi:MAG: hypothetical protein J0I12_34800 [Candidatus Eremiobacteraeota bacterium]|nr:hypothetical protein [Candidatus Eremiobacteraeota bacterium]